MNSKDKKITDEKYFVILNSRYFDEEWYCSNYDLEGFEPAYHYLYIGFKKLFNPGPNFSTLEYYACNNDVYRLDENPLLHYELFGKKENRQIKLSEKERQKRISVISNSEYFDGEWYCSNYDLEGFEPAYHYLFIGFKKLFNPGPNFNTLEYYKCNSSVEKSGINPLLHYELYGRQENRKITCDDDELSLYLSVNTELSKYYFLESNNKRILLVGHNCNNGGAEILLRNIIYEFRKMNIEVAVIVKKDGILKETYQKMVPTFIAENEDKVEYYIEELSKYGFKSAILNTVLTGDIISTLHKYNFFVINLIHELPYVIKVLDAENMVKMISEESDLVVFPSNFVAEKFESISKIQGKKLIQPQGLYNVYDKFNKKESKQKLIKKYNIPENNHIILNVGLGEYRKGFDIFFEVSNRLKNQNYTFIWAGNLDKNMEENYVDKINQEKNMIYLGFVEDKDELMSYYDACDVFMLTSREDPFPSVVLEAFNAKKPVVGFKNAGGFQDIVIDDETGYLVDFGSVDGLIDKISLLCENQVLNERLGENAKKLCGKYDFLEYVDILKTACINGEENLYLRNITKLTNSVLDLENVISNKNKIISSLGNDIQSKNYKIKNLKIKNKELNKSVNEEILKLEQYNKKLKRKNKLLLDQKNEILSSTSWKVTSPIRKLKYNVKKIVNLESKIHQNEVSNSSSCISSKKINNTFIDKLDVLLVDDVFKQIYGYSYSYKTYIIDENISRINLFFDKIDESVYELNELFSFLISFCNEFDYYLRIIYNFADFELFNDFLIKNNFKLPTNTSFLNLKNENYLNISLNEKNICTSWINAFRLQNTSEINSVIFFYLGHFNECMFDEYYYISKICYNDNFVVLNDDFNKLKEIKHLNFEYNVNMAKSFSERKTLYCDFGELFFEGISLLNDMIFNKIIDICQWSIYVLSDGGHKFKFNGTINLVSEKLDNFDLFLKINSTKESFSFEDENYIELYLNEVDDEVCNSFNIRNVENLSDFLKIDVIKHNKLTSSWPMKKIFDEINGDD